MCPVKTQIRMCICTVWSVFDVDSKGSKSYTDGQKRLWSDCLDVQANWVFAGHTCEGTLRHVVDHFIQFNVKEDNLN